MSGHSKWATIKRKKGEADAKRGQIFTKLVREITTSARLGGPDAAANPRLRAAIASAKAARMPAENIERGIKKGIGTLDGPAPEDVLYEGYGPGGIALLVEAQTDNRNRTSSEIRAALNKSGGSLGTVGSVAWMFQHVALFQLPAAQLSEDQILEVALAAGAEEVSLEEDNWLVICPAKAFATMLDGFEQANWSPERAELVYMAENQVPLGAEEGSKIVTLIEKLEDLDDVQKVWSNLLLAETST